MPHLIGLISHPLVPSQTADLGPLSLIPTSQLETRLGQSFELNNRRRHEDADFQGF